MTVSCYLAASPHAGDADQLYLKGHDNGNLWERTNHSIPLPTCSSPDALDSHCDVCTRENQVYVFCRHVLDKLVMEATGGKSITLETMDCPVFLPDSPELPNFPAGFIVFIAVAILLFLVVVGVLLHRRRGNKHETVRCEEGDAGAANAETAM